MSDVGFDVTLMVNNDPYNKIQKSPVTVGNAYKGVLKEECSLVDPVILLEIDSVPVGANYAYIEAFGRYYFIKNVESYRNGLWSVSLHCDVLMTYSAGILASPVVVARSSSNFNMLLNDDSYYCQENPHIFTKAFPSGFDTSTASYVLALIGQAATGEEE